MRTLLLIPSVVIGILLSASARSAPPELRTLVPDRATKLGQLMTSPGQLRQHYILSSDGVTWDLGASSDGRVVYVGTRSAQFRTPEKFSVGTPYSKLRARGLKEAITLAGFAWIVELPSGWRAALVRGPGMTDAHLLPSTPISFLYRTTD